MNLYSKIILFLVLTVLVNVSSGQINYHLPLSTCKAFLIIESDIENVDIYVDGVAAGNGKIFQTEIDTGFHIIQLFETAKRWNAKSLADTIHLTSCDELKLNYTFKPEILLDSEPQNASVYSGDSLIGYTPILIRPDFKNLILEKNDYLTKNISQNDIVSGEKVILDFIGEEKEKSFFDTPWSKILIGSAIALGAATAYIKLKADDKFEEYQITGDPALLDETDRLDIISGATFVALQVNIGLIVYLFLSD